MKGSQLGRQNLLIQAVLYVMLCCATTASSQQKSRIRFSDLPTSAHVYVDAKPVALQKGEIVVSTGWHELQVEAVLPGKGIVAYRRPVQITANQTTEMLLVWHRVTLGVIEDGRQGFFPAGMPGPAGEPGTSARPFQSLPPLGDVPTLRKLLQEARDILLDDFLAHVRQTLDSLNDLAVPEYYYTAGGPLSVIPGPSGPIGPQGQPGLPAEVRLIQTAQGTFFEESVARRLGSQEMEQTLSMLEDQLKHLTPEKARRAAPVKPFQVLTPEWKAELDKERIAKLAVPRPQNAIVELPSIWGPAGAPGRRGADGVPPPDVKPIRLTQEQDKVLLTELVEDKTAQEKVGQIRELLNELKRRVYLAEGRHLEQFPPALPAPR